MKKILTWLFCITLMSIGHAYELNGVMEDNNDGTYAVNLESLNGHEYTGIGVKQGDGTLTINVEVEGEGSETYIGLARPNLDGSYTLTLRNNSSGEMATGNLIKE